MSTASYKTTTTTVCFVLETMLAHPCFWRRTIYQHLSAITLHHIFQTVSLLFALHQDVCFFETGFFLPKTEWSRPTSINFLNTSFHRDCPIFCRSPAVSIWERTDLVPLGCQGKRAQPLVVRRRWGGIHFLWPSQHSQHSDGGWFSLHWVLFSNCWRGNYNFSWTDY